MALTAKTFAELITFTRASTGTRVNGSGLIESIAADQPRIDYDPVTLVRKGLLIEGQATNLLLYSDSLDNAAWSKVRTTVSAESATAPDGTATADKLVEDASAASNHFVQQGAVLADNTVYCYSRFFKSAERSKVYLALATKAGAIRGRLFDLVGGSSSQPAESGYEAAPTYYGIEDWGSGWFRCWVAHDLSTGGGGNNARLYLTNGTTPIYTGDGISGVYTWGAQLELGTFPTSYIQTVASQVTRHADSAVISTLSPWFSGAEGTFVIRATSSFITSSSESVFELWQSSSARMRAGRKIGGGADNSEFAFYVQNSGDQAWLRQAAAVSAGVSCTVAIAYKENDFAMSVNGGTVLTDSSGSLPLPTVLYLGHSASGQYLNGHLQLLEYHPQRLSNDQLQALSA